MDLAPIALFVYNRLEHTKKTIEALKQNMYAKESILYIFSDGPRNSVNDESVNEIRRYIRNIDGFKEVIIYEAKKNKGLGKSVIEGVSIVIETHRKIIVLEDDIVTSENFLKFMNQSLNEYKNNRKIYSIAGYMPPIETDDKSVDVFFIPRICSWGWGTWYDRWKSVDWHISDYDNFVKDKKQKKDFSRAGQDMVDMLINQVEGRAESWAIRFDYNRYKYNDALTVYPKDSFVINIGSDGSGEHKENSKKYNVQLNKLEAVNLRNNIVEDKDITYRFYKFFKPRLKSKLIILVRRLGIYKMAKYFYDLWR